MSVSRQKILQKIVDKDMINIMRSKLSCTYDTDRMYRIKGHLQIATTCSHNMIERIDDVIRNLKEHGELAMFFICNAADEYQDELIELGAKIEDHIETALIIREKALKMETV